MQKAAITNNHPLSRKKAPAEDATLDISSKNGAGPKKRRVSEEGDSEPVMVTSKQPDWAPLVGAKYMNDGVYQASRLDLSFIFFGTPVLARCLLRSRVVTSFPSAPRVDFCSI